MIENNAVPLVKMNNVDYMLSTPRIILFEYDKSNIDIEELYHQTMPEIMIGDPVKINGKDTHKLSIRWKMTLYDQEKHNILDFISEQIILLIKQPIPLTVDRFLSLLLLSNDSMKYEFDFYKKDTPFEEMDYPFHLHLDNISDKGISTLVEKINMNSSFNEASK